MTFFGGTYRNRRVLVTGHTGFKGSWLTLWLTKLGAQVSGFSLDPDSTPSHWDLIKLGTDDHRGDIRRLEELAQYITEVQPEIIFHLAAQPLVRRSYQYPLETWSTNVLGTANLLEACRMDSGSSVRAVVVVTTDKCYENREWIWGYREGEPLGGHDPYSASKAATELVAASYRRSFFGDETVSLIATARAGNVIGGGDWSVDRLIPDLVRAVAAKIPLEIRSPDATRPWQHVLDCLSGYLLLGQRLLEGDKAYADAWNFGPEQKDNLSVSTILRQIQTRWPESTWRTTEHPQPHEAQLLYLDSTKARQKLGWRPVWDLAEALTATVDWYRAYLENGRVLSEQQIESYVTSAKAAGIAWCLI